MDPSATDALDLQRWTPDSPPSIPDIQDHSDGPPSNDRWIVELYDRANRGPFLPTPTVALNPDVAAEIIEILCRNPSIEEPPRIPPLSPDLQNHPCRVFTALLRGLIYDAGATGWGSIIAEMSHLVFQHIKAHSMGVSVSDTVFIRVREVAMTRLVRSPFRPETVTWNPPGGTQEEIIVSWASPQFCKHVRLHLDEVARTGRESACQSARYFVLAESDHSGIVKSQLTDIEKNNLLSQMTFSTEYGCRLLHLFSEDGKEVIKWFGNRDFGRMVQKSLYDITCPGWGGTLDEVKSPDTEKVAVCQLIEVPAYTAASQIAWLVHVARFYLQTTLEIPTTHRPPKRRSGSSSHPTASPWLEWSDGLNSEVNSDAKTIVQFINGLLVPDTLGDKIVEKAFEKSRLYTDFIARPHNIPYHGDLGSFLYAEPPPILICDQRILNAISG